MRVIWLAAICLILGGCNLKRSGPNGTRTEFSLGQDAALEFHKVSGDDGKEEIYLAIDKNQSRAFSQGARAVKTKFWTSFLKDAVSDVAGIVSDRDAQQAAQDALETTTQAEQAALETTTDAELQLNTP